ncbi:MAG: TolC family protein [Acidobacteria bacterium]|nr:TolC family protein [Acidobacteriota bacterium]
MRARIPALCALLLVLTLGPGATAQDQPAQQTLRLSLDEAVERALDNNVDIAVAQFDPEIAAQNVVSAEGYYVPFLFANLDYNSTDSKGTNFFSGGDVVNTKNQVWSFGASLPVKTGGQIDVSWDNRRSDTNNAFTSFNPIYRVGITVNVTQPLLANLKIDAPRRQLRLSKINRQISDIQFRQSVINTVATTKQYYYDLVYALDNLRAAQDSLNLAKKLLEENEIRVKVGTMAPLDIVEARSEVAAREEAVIVAENLVADSMDNVKRVIFPQNDPSMWATAIVPTTAPVAEPVPVDLELAVQNALDNRTDVVAARKALERSDLDVLYRGNQTKPRLDLVAGYGGSGAGGTEIIREPPIGGEIIETIPGGYGDAFSEAFGNDFPSWNVGLQFRYSIPNKSNKALRAQAELSREQALVSLRRLELQVAQEVRTAGRGVLSGFKRVASTKAARELAAERLDAEQKKFDAGMSTTYLVNQAQRDLATQEVAELQAVAEYRKSLVNFQRVQEAGVSGLGAAVVVGGSSSSQAGQAVLSGAAASSVNQATGIF